MIDRRQAVWIIEKCPVNKPPLKRIWTAAGGISFRTRGEAIKWIKNWLDIPRELANRYIYRATFYTPAKGKK